MGKTPQPCAAITSVLHTPTKETTMEREYPDPAERYEDLHREQREDERAYDEYLEDDQ